MNNKRGQVTIFIILALIIVVGVALVITFFPKIKSSVSAGPQNPQEYMDTCLIDSLEENIETISLQGGKLIPENSYLYNNYEIEYLCYTPDYYRTCVVQIPFIKTHLEKEILESVEGEIDSCLNSMKESYEGKGYNVILDKGENKVELLPKRVVMTIGTSMTLTKKDSVNYESFNIILNNNLYELSSIASSITEWETTYGDVDHTTYMDYYPDLKVEKYKQGEGTTIYILTDRNTEKKFQFASRSLAWPLGYV